MKEVILTEDQFDARFTIKPNHITGNEAFGGMYETYGEELEYIRTLVLSKATKCHVWTILECEGQIYYSSGYHYVNRLGYLVTNEPFGEDEDITVELEDLTDHSEEDKKFLNEDDTRFDYTDGEEQKMDDEEIRMDEQEFNTKGEVKEKDFDPEEIK